MVIFFLISTGNLLIILYKLTKFQAPSSNIFRDILLTRFLADFFNGHNSRKGDNSDSGQLFFQWGIHIWNFKTLACTVHKIWHPSYFVRIFSNGHNSRKEDNSDKKRKRVSTIFPWGIHIWNFNTLACTVFDERTDGRTDGQPETNMIPQLLRSWGHNKISSDGFTISTVCSPGYYSRIMIMPFYSIFILDMDRIFREDTIPTIKTTYNCEDNQIAILDPYSVSLFIHHYCSLVTSTWQTKDILQ